jgi:hypothetical protein
MPMLFRYISVVVIRSSVVSILSAIRIKSSATASDDVDYFSFIVYPSAFLIAPGGGS